MAENFSLGRIRGENQLIYLGTGQLIGVQDISINQNFGNQPLNYIGIQNKNLNQIVNQEQFSDVSIDAFLINQDFFIALTGHQPVNIFILRQQSDLNENYCLVSGYLNSYSSKYVYGQIPQISTSFKFINNVGKIPTGSLDGLSYSQLTGIRGNIYSTGTNYLIPHGGSIDLSLNESTGNRVLQYSINVSVSRVPFYNIGSRFPIKTNRVFPITVNCDFSLEVGIYSGTQLRDIPQNKQIQDVNLQINDYNGGGTICSYNFPAMELVSETYNTTVDGNTTVTKRFTKEIFD